MLYAIPNLSSQSVFKVDPWTFVPEVPAAVRATKKDFIDWETKHTTRHCFFSAFEGVLSTVRVDSVSNPPHLMHGIVADYDNHNITSADIDILRTRPVSEWNPAWGSRTFSGGARLVWLFEEPLRVPEHTMMKEFLKLMARKLKLNDQLAGFDKEGSYDKPQQYYEVGVEWRPIGGDVARIPNVSLNCWMFEAGNKVDWSDKRYRLPIADVAREIESRWPGKWPGEFLLDTRGPRFWDDTASNPTACIVRESGMQCFSGGEPFLPWAKILGQEFVDRYQEKQVGLITAETYFDGKEYWRRDKYGLFQNWGKDDMTTHLRVKYKLRGGTTGPAKGNEPGSEIERVLEHIREHNRVKGALPFVHMPSGRLSIAEKQYLNTASAKCLPPADVEVNTWGEGFPWLAGYFDAFFDPPEQKEWFFSWLQRFYGCALKMQPEPGQALFIVGPTGNGKTLLSDFIVGTMVGGFAEGTNYLLGSSQFTTELTEPLLTVNDMVAGTDPMRHAKYSAIVKRIVANEWMRFEEKYQKSGRTRWRGRVMVTCNANSYGMQILPNMEQSNLDKVSLLRCRDGETGTVFGPTYVLEPMIAQELPYFCKWLLGFKVPERWVGTSRYGVESYHQAQLYRHSLQQSSSFTFYELLESFVHSWGAASPGATHWEGNPTQMLMGMVADDGLRQLAAKYQANQVAILLGNLKSLGYNLEKGRVGGSRMWRIPVDITPPQHTRDDVAEGGTDDDGEPDEETKVVVG